MQIAAGTRRIHSLLNGLRTGALVPDPDFQRRLVWSNKHKSDFIETVLRGYPFPEIYIAAGEVNPDTGEATEMLVDGQQRLTTLKQYFDASPDLKLSSGIIPYSELTKEQQRSFLDYLVVVRDLGQTSITEIKEIFQRINSTNYSLNAMEIHNARYDGEIKQFADRLSQESFFQRHRVFNSTDIRRMRDVSFALSMIITVMSTYFSLESEFEDYLRQYNDEFEEEQTLKIEFQKIFHFIDKCGLPEKSRVWRKADLFTLIIEIHRTLFREKMNVEPVELGERLLRFYNLVNKSAKADEAFATEHQKIMEYYNAAIQGTNSRTNRIKRGKIIQDVINGDFEFEVILRKT